MITPVSKPTRDERNDRANRAAHLCNLLIGAGYKLIGSSDRWSSVRIDFTDIGGKPLSVTVV